MLQNGLLLVICIEVSVLRRADGAIILGNRLVLRFLGAGINQTM